jgi:hypothetical protein
MTKDRLLVEVEIKITKADIDRDKDKAHRSQANLVNDVSRIVPERANFLYYFVPEHLSAYASGGDTVHAACGVLSLNHAYRHGRSRLPTVAVHKKSTGFHSSKLSETSVNKIIAQQASTMCSLANEFTMMALNWGKDNWQLGADVVETVPSPELVTPKECIFDDGSRTGRAVRQHEFVDQYKVQGFKPTVIQLHDTETHTVVRHND